MWYINLLNAFDSAHDKTCICKIQEKKEKEFAKAAYLSFPYHVKECFQYEVTEFPPFTNGGKIYHSKNQIY